MTASIHKIEEEVSQQSTYTEENTSTIEQFVNSLYKIYSILIKLLTK